jgi:hypothetical protein
MRRVILLLTAALACAGRPSSADELTPKEAAAGRKVYVAKCAKCHKFHEPKDYSEADWGRWLENMGRKSKLNVDQKNLLERYLGEYRAGRIAKVK